MVLQDIALRRLYRQGIARPAFAGAAEAVAWLGAVQAQDYLASLWAVGLRVQGATEATIEQAIARGDIIRIWFMRGTIHFLAAPDVRWMLDLVRSRLHPIAASDAANEGRDVDRERAIKSLDVVVKALEGGRQLTRPELAAALEQAGVATPDLRLVWILHRAQVEGLVCHGARRGKQLTYTLLEEWVPPATTLPRDVALAEFARRYFTSHGPATLRDFVWWSGLLVVDAKAGLEAIKSELEQETVDGQTYWRAPAVPAALSARSTLPVRPEPPVAHVLPSFDEFLVGYKNRSAAIDPQHDGLWNHANGLLSPSIVIGGQVVGTWRRTLKRDAVLVEPVPFVPLSPAEQDAFAAAACRYAGFLGLPLALPHPTHPTTHMGTS